MTSHPLFGFVLQSQATDAASSGAEPVKPASHPLDALTGGVFSAATSGDRAARVRAWLATEPGVEDMQEVFKELNTRDRSAAKVLREKLDEIRRSEGQEAKVQEWVEKAEQLLAAPTLSLADATAWQREAAKAGAPLSKEPLAHLRSQMHERVRVVEDLQKRSQVQREAAMLLAQRIEVLSTKGWQEAAAAEATLQADVQSWGEQVQSLQHDAQWGSVDAKLATALASAAQQLQLVVQAFSEALTQARLAATDNSVDLPKVPVWADEIRALRGEVAAPEEEAQTPEQQAAHAELREQAAQKVQAAIAALEQELLQGHSKNSVAAAQTLRNLLKELRRHVASELEGVAHAALAKAGELEGWQRWRADQLRQELVQQAEALVERPLSEVTATAEGEAAQPRALPTSKLSPRKLQESLRQLREQWKQTDQGGVPNHVLWKRFDAACNEAYRIVQAWLTNMKEQTAQQKSLRMQLMDEVSSWTAAHVEQVQKGVVDWKAAHRDLLHFGKRWREAGHLSEKVYAELYPRWKAALKEAGQQLELAQKASVQLRQTLIEEARALGAAATLRVDAIKALQQRWQQEAQTVPLERRQEQKLWDAFRKPLDEAFQRKPQRAAVPANLSEHDQKVLEAARALEEANASGDAQAIHTALQALEAALRGRDEEQEKQAATAAAPAAPVVESDPEAPRPPSASALEHKPAIAVRGDDRPQAQVAVTSERTTRSAARDHKGPRQGGRDTGRAPRAPRLADAAFRAQRHAVEHAQTALRKLSEQAHGAALTQLLEAWEKRQPDLVPSASDLGRKVAGAQRQAWVQAVTGAAPSAAETAATALLRLEIAAEVPTPAAQMTERRALQLQLLTRRHDPSPAETWSQDVATVLASAHTSQQERRLQQALKVLLRR